MVQYSVFKNSVVIGTAELDKQGLYYRIVCCCDLQNEPVRLIARCEKGNVSVGICTPGSMGFGLEKRIPVKHLGTEVYGFLIESVEKGKKVFCLLDDATQPELPDVLEKCRFTMENGIPALIIEE